MSDFAVCYVCRFVWCVLIVVGCAYLVFWKDFSGWWFVFALILIEGSCKKYRDTEEES